MAQRKSSPQQVRIIGGKYGGRKLRFTGDASLRPTLGRTRETLFNWLRPDIADTRCLDAYAGSGALGFEALSQGAAAVVLLEKHAPTVRSLEATATDLGVVDNCHIVRTDTLDYLKNCVEAFDIVFVDPPFDDPSLLTQTLELLTQRSLVKQLIYAEARTMSVLEEAAQHSNLELIRQTRSGDTVAALLIPCN